MVPINIKNRTRQGIERIKRSENSISYACKKAFNCLLIRRNKRFTFAVYPSQKRHMFKLLTLTSLFAVLSVGAKGQSENAKIRALIESSTLEKGTGKNISGTYRSMEEIRYGAVPGLKGVQVRLEQPVCSGQSGSLWLVNESGEPWSYRVIDRKGPLVTEGATGYNRKIGNLSPGNYLIQFTHAKGISVLDNFTVKEGNELEIDVTATPLTTEGQNSTVKFHVNAQTGMDYEWDFGDGQFTFNENTVSHTYQAPGTYVVRCAVGNFDCRTEKKLEIIIHGPATFAEQKD